MPMWWCLPVSLNLEQVAAIHRAIIDEDIRGPHGELIRIEMFCHGALCMAVSGKCYLSLHEMNSSANRGHAHRYAGAHTPSPTRRPENSST